MIYSKKYTHWILEQRQLFRKLKKYKNNTIWIHCSSLGEYEYIKPLISKIQKDRPIHLTFFSPSGYRNFKDFQLVNTMSYLPWDLKSRMHTFIRYINPKLVIISKNDIWPNMIRSLSKKNIPIYLVGLKINPVKINNWSLKYYYKKNLLLFSHIFCEDGVTYNFLKSQNIYETSLIKNLRINQIMQDANNNFDNDKIIHFINGQKSIIYGSTEDNDYRIIQSSIVNNKKIKHIIVPHNINQKTMQSLKKYHLDTAIFYSKAQKKELQNSNILVVDVVGILKKLYKYTTIAYVGGGFDKGVHNTLEPAIHGNQLLFGPNHNKFPETHFFIQNQIASVINNKIDFEKKICLRLKENTQNKTQIISKTLNYMNQNKQDVNHVIKIIMG